MDIFLYVLYPCLGTMTCIVLCISVLCIHMHVLYRVTPYFRLGIRQICKGLSYVQARAEFTDLLARLLSDLSQTSNIHRHIH